MSNVQFPGHCFLFLATLGGWWVPYGCQRQAIAGKHGLYLKLLPAAYRYRYREYRPVSLDLDAEHGLIHSEYITNRPEAHSIAHIRGWAALS